MVGPWVMNSMYSHQERSQGWAKQVSEESSGWYAHKLVKQAVTTVSERELWLEKSKLTWYHSEWEEIVGSGCTSYITYTSEYFCELDAIGWGNDRGLGGIGMRGGNEQAEALLLILAMMG